MPAPPRILGLHHVTAITSDAQKNVDFYAGVLGLKLVKVSVNGDDPTSLHLCYGDEQASPGSLVTFGVHRWMARGKTGWGLVHGIDFAAAPAEIPALRKRLAHADWWHSPSTPPDGRDDEFLSFPDPDAMPIAAFSRFAGSLSPAGEPLRLGRAALSVADPRPTVEFIERWFGWFAIADESVEESDEAPAMWLLPGGDASSVDAVRVFSPLHVDGWKTTRNEKVINERRGRPGAGSVHHVAFRIAGDDELAELHAKLAEAGVEVSPIIDRFYYKSIRFREPGGILLEVATDGPGFAVDEPPDRLGRTLCLPPWLEPRRAEIERAIPRLVLPTGEVLGGR